jgi:hypothetical protein
VDVGHALTVRPPARPQKLWFLLPIPVGYLVPGFGVLPSIV